MKFDPLWLDLYEKVIVEARADKITPLIVNPGRLLLSNSRLYFQPFNNIEPVIFKKIFTKNTPILKKKNYGYFTEINRSCLRYFFRSLR